MRLMLWNTTQKEKYSAINKSLRNCKQNLKLYNCKFLHDHLVSLGQRFDNSDANLRQMKQTFLKAYNFES